ncbi:MAG: DUF4282 domain-containing protein, partial [Humibacillus sp.]|nr:DUF4282 domain-containing protein [Humibacillus sp.]
PPPQPPHTPRSPTYGGSSSAPPASGGAGGSESPTSPTTANVQAAMQNVAGDSSGFISALFDFTFTRFVTPMLVRFVYLLATVVLAITWLAFLIASFTQGIGYGLFVLIIGPIIVIIYLAIIRMTLEFYLSVVRMSQDIHQRLPQG